MVHNLALSCYDEHDQSCKATRYESQLTGEKIGMDVLAVNEFTSARKRMSVLVRRDNGEQPPPTALTQHPHDTG